MILLFKITTGNPFDKKIVAVDSVTLPDTSAFKERANTLLNKKFFHTTAFCVASRKNHFNNSQEYVTVEVIRTNYSAAYRIKKNTVNEYQITNIVMKILYKNGIYDSSTPTINTSFCLTKPKESDSKAWLNYKRYVLNDDADSEKDSLFKRSEESLYAELISNNSIDLGYELDGTNLAFDDIDIELDDIDLKNFQSK